MSSSTSWLCPVSAVVCWSCFHPSCCYLLFLQPGQSSCFICSSGMLPGQGTRIFLAPLRALSSDGTKFHSVSLVEIAWFCPHPGITGATWNFGMLVDRVSCRAGTGSGGTLVVGRQCVWGCQGLGISPPLQEPGSAPPGAPFPPWH